MNCKEGTRKMASQIEALLTTLDQSAYASPLEIINGASIGQHVRHIFDFYHCIQLGTEHGMIDYSSRERNARIESDKTYAKQQFQIVIAHVCDLEDQEEICIKADFSIQQTAKRPLLQSSIGRELLFAYDHAVHHLAIIKIGIQEAFPYIALADHFGIAPATLKHRAGEKSTDS